MDSGQWMQCTIGVCVCVCSMLWQWSSHVFKLPLPSMGRHR